MRDDQLSTRGEIARLAAFWPASIAAVLLALSLAGCVTQPRSQQSYGAISPTTSNAQRTFDVLTNTSFPRRHGRFTRYILQQRSASQFKASYIDTNSQATITYYLNKIKKYEYFFTEKTPPLRGTNSVYLNKFFENKITSREKESNSGKYSKFEYIHKRGNFKVETLSTPLWFSWNIERYSEFRNPNKIKISHVMSTGYQDMILSIVITYDDYIAQQARDENREMPSINAVIDIHRALAREMLEPTRTFLR